MHLNEGKLLSFLDQELTDTVRVETRLHLSSCPDCRARLERIRLRSADTETHLRALAPVASQIPDILSAKTKLSVQHSYQKENTNMWDKIFTRRLRPLWGMGLVALILAVAFAFPSVRAAANNFLGLFRVEQIAVVEINPANLPEQLGSSVTFEELVSQNITFEQFGEPKQVASVDVASAETGFAVRLPEKAVGEPDLWVQYGSQVDFEVDLARLRLLLLEIGRGDVRLPDELDGTTATLTVEPSVVAGYGSCDFSHSMEELDKGRPNNPSDCTMFAQIPSPLITAPEGLNLAEIGRAFLQVMGMTEAEAARFSDTIDWTTTLIVPIPQYGVDYIDVKVDGVDGVLFQQDLDRYQPNFMLLWVKEGVIYTLTGTGDGMAGVALANSLR
jgi:hypothetical protein